MVVDRHPDRLRLAEQVGAIPVDDSKGSPVDQVMEHTNGMGADRGAECVGYQAHDPRGHEDNSATLNDLVSSVRFTGGIGTIGVYVPQDPGGPNELAKHGKAAFDFGSFWFKGQHMGTGQCPVKRYNRYLRSLIAEERSSRPGSFPTTCLSTRPPKLTSTSMPGKKAGRRLSYTQDRRPDLDPWVR